jgi:uncharacterized protein (TIGR04206 family)
MVLSADEQRHWRELEHQLAQDHRLTALAARLDTHQREHLRVTAWLLGTLLAVTGLAVAAGGAVSHTGVIVGVGLGLLLAAPIVALAVASRHRPRRRPPH